MHPPYPSSVSWFVCLFVCYSMAVECSDDADEEDDLKTVIEEEQALNNLKNVHALAGVTAPLSMRPPEGRSVGRSSRSTLLLNQFNAHIISTYLCYSRST